MVLLLSPHQQQEWHGTKRNWLHLYLSRNLRTFIADKFFVTARCIIRPTRHRTCLPQAGRTGGIYAPLGEDKTGAAASCGRHLQPYRICALLSVGGYQPGIRQDLTPVYWSAEEQLRFQFKRLVRNTELCSVFRNMPIYRVSRITLNNSCNGAVRRVRQSICSNNACWRNWKNELLYWPQREPVGGRVPLFRPQPSDALLQATDGKDIYAIYHGLPKWNIRMKSKKNFIRLALLSSFFVFLQSARVFRWNNLHITELATVAKSLPHSLRKAYK